MLGQGQLHQDAVDGVVLVVFVDQREEVFLGQVYGLGILNSLNPRRWAVLILSVT